MGAGAPRVAVDRVERNVPVERDLARLADGVGEGIAADDGSGMGKALADVFFPCVVKQDRAWSVLS